MQVFSEIFFSRAIAFSKISYNFTLNNNQNLNTLRKCPKTLRYVL
jgi:hypothetical protein